MGLENIMRGGFCDCEFVLKVLRIMMVLKFVMVSRFLYGFLVNILMGNYIFSLGNYRIALNIKIHAYEKESMTK